MLSTDLQALADQFAPRRQRGVELTPMAVAALVSALEAAAHQARALERSRLSASARVTDRELPANVTRLHPARPVPPRAPVGGDAA
jgi:hypothetical protein